MAAIAGTAGKNRSELIEKMLEKMAHRGWDWHQVIYTLDCNLYYLLIYRFYVDFS